MKYKFFLHIILIILACAFNISCENDNDELWMSLHMKEKQNNSNNNNKTQNINDENNKINNTYETADTIFDENIILMNETLKEIKQNQSDSELIDGDYDGSGGESMNFGWNNDEETLKTENILDLDIFNIKENSKDDLKSPNLYNIDDLTELLSDENLPRDEEFDRYVEKNIEPKPGQRSLVIIFDGTASMTDDLAQLRAGAEYIVDKLSKREDNPIYNYILVPFRDPEIGPKIVTTNQQKLLDELQNIKISGGGDCPEHALGGIIMALESALPQSFVYVFTDAVAKDFALDERVIELVEKKQTPINFFITGFCKSETSPEYLVFQKIAAASNGQIFDLKKRDIKQVITSIETLLDKNRVPVISYDSNEGKNQTINFDVDKNLKELTVSVAGSNPEITVTNPKNETYDHGPDVLDLDNIKVVKVDQPEAGKWKIDTSSNSAHSVRLSGISDVTFSYGFSLNEPNGTSEISYRPLLGVDNVLTIIPSDSRFINELTSTSLSLFHDINSNSTPFHFELPLKKIIIDGSDVYVTIPFPPPRQLFKIHINGNDYEGNPIQRLLTTVIKSTIEELPEVIVEPDMYEIFEGDSLTLKCQINSFIPIKAQWKKNNYSLLKELETGQSSAFYYSIDNADISDGGKYNCHAVNDVGSNMKFVTIKVQKKQLNVNTPNKQMTLVEGTTNVTLYCDIEPNIDVEVDWLFNGDPLENLKDYFLIDGSNIIIKNVDRESQGKYTCVGRMNKLIRRDTIDVSVSHPAEFLDDEIENLNIPYGSSVNLTCRAYGVPTPTKSWIVKGPNGSVELNRNDYIFIENMRPEDEKIYYCKIQNGVGLPVIRTINLEGKSIEPPNIYKTNNTDIILNVGDDLELTCKCCDCTPIIEHKWTYESDEIKSITQNSITYGSDPDNAMKLIKIFSSKMEILGASDRDEGTYKCIFTNDFGEDEQIFNVKVLNSTNIEQLTSVNDNINVVEGSTAYIKCEVNGEPIQIIQWSKDGQPLLSSQRTILENNNTLIVDDVKMNDAGIYSCSGINNIGSIVKNFTLLVIVPPTTTSDREMLQSAIAGDNVILPCQVNTLHPPKISWMLNGREIDTNNKKYTKSDFSLSFKANDRDTGIYECHAINDAGDIKLETILVVYATPKIYPANDEIIKVTSNSDVILKCDASGYPIPDVKWRYNGNTIESNSINEHGNLVIKNITTDDDGAYVCDAFNGIGLTQKVFYVIAYDTPIITTNIPKEQTFIATEEFGLTQICEANGNPHPDVFWTKDDERLVLDVSNTLKLDWYSNPKGTYTCHAENSEGSDFKTMKINVLEKPKHETSTPISSKQNVLIKENLNLKCPIIGGNDVTWLKDNRLINFKFNPTLKLENDQTLTLISMSSSMTGNYTCISENEAGKTEFTYEVLALVPPTNVMANLFESRFNSMELDKDIPEIVLNSDEKFQLSCQAQGNPKPEIYWLKDENVISTSEIINIENVHINDSGIYICLAKNQYGTSEKAYQLIVTAHPSYNNGDLEQYYQLNIGEDFDLNCIMTGYPTPVIKWFKNGNILNEYQELLEFRNIKLDDAGLYKCIGENTLGNVEILFHVDLFDKPSIINITKDDSVITNNHLNLTCSAKGYPLPILSWLFNGRVQTTTARIHFDDELQNELNKSNIIYVDLNGNGFTFNTFFNDENLNKLTEMNSYGIVRYEKINKEIVISLDLIISKIKKEKSGKYTCVSYNSIGKTEEQVTVQVLIPPKLTNPNIKEIQDIDILEGLPVILTCPIIGHPTPTIQWFKDDITFELSNRNTKTDNSNKYLTIVQTTINDAGMYMCLATNIAGETKLYFNLTILVPPTLIPILTNPNELQEMDDSTSEHINVNYGDDIILNCPVTGNPKPITYWSKVDMDSVKGNYLLAINSSLHIQTMKKSESFMCTANSTIGTIQKIYHVNVQAPPDGEMKDEQISTRIYHAFTLECRINGSPEPNITWHKDGKMLKTRTEIDNENMLSLFISSDGTILKIISPTKADSGRYVCIATNNLGSANKIFDVEIDVPVEWSPWGSWSVCSKTCGKGIRSRKRVCLLPNGMPADGTDEKCIGQNSQIQGCEIAHCPINGGWGEWSFWTPCSSNCVSIDRKTDSVRRRYRKCDSPAPEMGGMPCIGADTQQEECAVPYCPINGDWSEWTPWGQCSVTCGSGFQNRRRSCTNPVPRHGGQICQGKDIEVKLCNDANCPVDGDWSSWSPWSKCSNTCGTGYKQRKRTCNNPEPAYGGFSCNGDNVEFETCKFKPCANELNRNQPQPEPYTKKNYTPYMSFDIMPPEKSSDEIVNSNQGPNYQFSEGAPIKYVQPLINNTVIVTLESKNQISEEIVEMNINPSQMLTGRIQNDQSYKIKKCEIGHQLNPNTETCIDIDECQEKLCHPTAICENTIGSYICKCKVGYKKSLKNNECIDINECILKTHDCSHYCQNLAGSYKCSCPSNYVLDNSNKKCISINYPQQRDKPTLLYLSRDLNRLICPHGFHVENGKCVDIDECLTMEEKCGYSQTCLNTKGSYLCVPTNCPDDYIRELKTGHCIQMCKELPFHKCSDGAKISQSISYITLSLTKIDYKVPILKLVVPGVPIDRTTFSFIERTNIDVFKLDNTENTDDVVYLYANSNLKQNKIYQLKIIAHSYDNNVTSILYTTRFIIYITLQ